MLGTLLLVSLCAEPAPAPPASRPAGAEADAVARADALVGRGANRAALAALGPTSGPPANLVRARALRGLGDLAGAEAALERAAGDAAVRALADLERGLVALARGDIGAAAELLLRPVEDGEPAASVTVLPLATALAAADPARLVAVYDRLERLRPGDDPDARSRLLGLKAEAMGRLGRQAEATLVEKQRYLEEPVSLATPSSSPPGVLLSVTEILTRAEALQSANRNERVIEALEPIAEGRLDGGQRCQRQLALGLARRKLHEYERAESHLAQAARSCRGDEDRQRRALYLQAKVVSIRDGLRAVPLVEAFARRYPGHSMTDDVLFWAGDLYQRRDRAAEARAYYDRITSLPSPDDYCLEARWRLAWMSYRQGDLDAARTALEKLMVATTCAPASFDRARARYWLARIAERQGDVAAAVALFRAALGEDAMGFYAQLALGRLAELAPEVVRELASAPVHAVPADVVAQGCAAAHATEPAFAGALALLARGLGSDAARVLLALAPPAHEILGTTHAGALGLVAKNATRPIARGDGRCERDVRLWVALLLDRAGAYKEAHWRLRTEFAAELGAAPAPATVGLWRAAYPLAWRDEIEAAERDSGLPDLLLQALAREESAFDPRAVSWAGAYGLTQLLLSIGRGAGRLVEPRVELERAEDLLDPRVNARLGGALLASLLRRYDGAVALALAAYNAGPDVATAWRSRWGEAGLDVLAEEITIQETRGYVKRVLRTYGIYRWLYRGELPALDLRLGRARAAAGG